MEYLETVLSVIASLLSIFAVVRGEAAHKKIAKLEQQFASQINGGQSIAGNNNRQVGGSVGGNVG